LLCTTHVQSIPDAIGGDAIPLSKDSRQTATPTSSVAPPLMKQERGFRTSHCSNLMNDPQARRILQQSEKLGRDYFGALKSQPEFDREFAQLNARAEQHYDERQEAILRGLQDMMFTVNGLNSLFDFLISERALSADERERLQALGVKEEVQETFVAELRQLMHALTGHGARYDSTRGVWDLSSLQVRILRTSEGNFQMEDPYLFSALAVFFSPNLPTELINPERREAMIAGDTAFTPMKFDVANSKSSGKDIYRVIPYTRNKWIDISQRWHNAFVDDMTAYQQAAKNASGYSNIAQGFFQNHYFATAREKEMGAGRAPVLIELEAAMNRVATDLNQLKALGVDKAYWIGLSRQAMEADRFASQHLDVGIRKINGAIAATIALPFIPVAWQIAAAAAPYFGGAVGTALAAGTTKTLAMMYSTTFLMSAVQAGLKAANSDTNFLCEFYDELVTRGSETLLMTPIYVLLPTAFGAAGKAGTLVGGGAPLAEGIFSAGRFGLALWFLKGNVVNSNVIIDCVQSIMLAHKAANEGDVENVAYYNERAISQCLDGGVSIAFAIDNVKSLATDPTGLRDYRTVSSAAVDGR
jgi:hypothetical protein